MCINLNVLVVVWNEWFNESLCLCVKCSNIQVNVQILYVLSLAAVVLYHLDSQSDTCIYAIFQNHKYMYIYQYACIDWSLQQWGEVRFTLFIFLGGGIEGYWKHDYVYMYFVTYCNVFMTYKYLWQVLVKEVALKVFFLFVNN